MCESTYTRRLDAIVDLLEELLVFSRIFAPDKYFEWYLAALQWLQMFRYVAQTLVLCPPSSHVPYSKSIRRSENIPFLAVVTM